MKIRPTKIKLIILPLLILFMILWVFLTIKVIENIHIISNSQIIACIMTELMTLFIIFQLFKIINHSFVIIDKNNIIIEQANIKIAKNNQKNAGFHFKIIRQNTKFKTHMIKKIRFSNSSITRKGVKYISPFLLHFQNGDKYIWDISTYTKKQVSIINNIFINK